MIYPLMILAAAAIVAGAVWWSRRAERARDPLQALYEAEATAYAAWQAAKRAHETGDYEGHAVQSLRAADAQYKHECYLKAKAALDAARGGL